jgi:hypothetical protein
MKEVHAMTDDLGEIHIHNENFFSMKIQAY